MAIQEISAHEILDGRGIPTIRACAKTDRGSGVYSVASGAMAREHEGQTSRDPDRYEGQGVKKAVQKINKELAPLLNGEEASDWRACDRKLEAKTDPPLFSKIGSNTVSAVSGAVLQASGPPPIYRRLSDERDNEPALPRPIISMLSSPSVESGLRDIMVVPLQDKSIPELIKQAADIRDGLRQRLKGEPGAGVWGGFAVDLAQPEFYLELLSDVLDEQGYNRDGLDMGIAIDMNGAFIYNEHHDLYKLGDTILKSGGIRGHILRWCDDFPVVALEDPLHPEDREGWQRLQIALENLPRTVYLFAAHFAGSQPERTKMIFDHGRANGLVARLGQAGTMRRMEQAVKQARTYGATTVLGARTGETADATLVDIATGWGVPFIRCGGLMRSERTEKYNRLLSIAHRSNLSVASLQDE